MLGNQRADLSIRVNPVADLEAFAEIGDAADKLVIDFALDKEPCAGAANLAGIGKHSHAGAGHRSLEVGIGEDDVGRLAAELERHALQIAGRGLNDQLPG